MVRRLCVWVVRVLQHRRLPRALALLQPLATSIAAVSAAATSAATSPHRLEHLMTSQRPRNCWAGTTQRRHVSVSASYSSSSSSSPSSCTQRKSAPSSPSGGSHFVMLHSTGAARCSK
mmetsp:Transcript_37952/g.125755  ORF Transcript_37952/g.125755 Transcript_37952/m.125755 type:complete len:118 (-) Transcript_37952:339-692(-)